MGLITKAAKFAAAAHAGQYRKFTDQPYIMHPIRVAGRVATHDNAFDELVAAAFLHDVIEDCNVNAATLASGFGDVVASLVVELTNVKVRGISRAQQKMRDRDRISLVSKEAKLIKLVDRIDNLSEADMTSDFAKVYAEESMLLFAVLTDVDNALFNEGRQLCNAIMAYHENKPIAGEISGATIGSGKLVTKSVDHYVQGLPNAQSDLLVTDAARVNLSLRVSSLRLEWRPQPNITTYELARCIELFFSRGSVDLEILFDKLDDSCKRHWQCAR